MYLDLLKQTLFVVPRSSNVYNEQCNFVVG